MDAGGGKNPQRPLTKFSSGSPGVSTLKRVSGILLEATKNVLHDDCDIGDLFVYGAEGGDRDFRQHLAQFLSDEYDDHVNEDNLLMTAGATHGLHLILTLLVPPSSPVFVVDPTYFFGRVMIEKDLQRTIVPVPSDSQGVVVESFEDLLQTHHSKASMEEKASTHYPYWAAVYMVPTFNNPLGISYSPELCKKLVSLARQYNVLLLSEDVYNLMYYTDLADVPKRLLVYDMPSDPGYEKGHVLSNCSFSKIMAPSIRLGWMEGPKEIVRFLANSLTSVSGGAFNHYMGKLMTDILHTGQQREHVHWLRGQYKIAMTNVCDTLDKCLPEGCSFYRPKGGFFVWIQLRPDVDSVEFCTFCEKNFQMTFVTGPLASPSGGYRNYVRLAVSFIDKDALPDATERFCEAYKQYLGS